MHDTTRALSVALSGIALDPRSHGTAQRGMMHANQKPLHGEKKSAWRWVLPSERAAVLGFNVGGMLYVGTSMRFKAQEYHQPGMPAPFLINPDLPTSGETGFDRGYIDSHPAYAEMQPEERMGYLAWLADGRRNPRARSAFPLLFLYGLEHRVMVEKPDQHEIAQILAELIELRAAYGARNDFVYNFTRLIHEAEWKLLQDNGPALAAYRPELLDPDFQIPLALRICVGRMVRGSVPIPFDWAMGTMLHVSPDNGGFRKRIGYTKVKQEFLDLARIRFATDMPPNGIRIRDQKDSRIWHQYVPACRYFSAQRNPARSPTPDSIPDPVRLTWNRMGKLCDAVIDELTPYAKALGVENKNAGSMAALAALPVELHDKPYAARIQRLKTWLDDLPREPRRSTGLEISSRAGQDDEAHLTPAAHKPIADLLAVLGWGMEPDPLFNGLKARPNSGIVMFPLLEDKASRAPPSEGWDAAVLVAAVMANLAQGGSPDLHSDAIAAGFDLSSPEAYRLTMLVQWLRNHRTTPAEFRKLAKAATPDQAAAIARVLCSLAARIDLAGSNGMALLELIFDTLSLPRGDLYAALHSAAGRDGMAHRSRQAHGAFEPVLMERASGAAAYRIPPGPPAASARRAMEAVPGPELLASGMPPAPLAPIDMAAVARIRAETDVVSTLLATIYEEDAPARIAVPAAPIVSKVPPSAAEPAAVIDGLDAEHAGFLTALCQRESWTRAEFSALASSLGLMADGASEVVNDWAFDRFDDAIIEDGEPLTINIALMR